MLAETGDLERAKEEAEKRAKVPSASCAEFYRYRWAMQLANVTVATDDPRRTRRLSKEERQAVNAEMEKRGAMTPAEFKKAVRAVTTTNRDNLDRLLVLPDADKSLILDPARKLVSTGVLAVLWPYLGERGQRHTLTNLRRGKTITARALLEDAPQAQPAFDTWWEGQAMRVSVRAPRSMNPMAST
jgi:hypothetical protein